MLIQIKESDPASILKAYQEALDIVVTKANMKRVITDTDNPAPYF